MKITYRRLFLFLIMFALLLECDYFVNAPVNLMSDYNQKYILISSISVLLAGVCLCNQKIKTTINKEILRLKCPMIITVVAAFIAGLYSFVVNGEEINVILINLLPFFSVLLAFPIAYILKVERTRKRFLQLFFLIVVISLLYRSRLTFDYLAYHKLPNPTLLIPNGGVKLRYGILKLYPTSVGAIAVILMFAYSISSICKSKITKIFLQSFSIAGYIYFVFLYQARMWSLMILLTFVFLLLYKRNKVDKKIVLYFLIAAFIGYLIVSGIAESFFNSFSYGSEYWHSTEARINGFGPLLKNILFHPLGNGFSNSFVNEGTIYYPEDFLGLHSFFRFGWISIAIYYLYIKFFVVNLKICRNGSYRLIQMAITVFIIVGCLIMGIFMTRRLFALAIAFGLSVNCACLDEEERHSLESRKV